ncbi:uncharacterized protein B0T23DRAFT_134313 [Neurospora hispaniola]|uniref:Secreted protein n=1 Tax=Neurospora hispaniola TaxID=588809 RepID=A0AAJ0MRD8_9PEZI|nr:hypothetical protein B0T23DRAFT_134313 [Neurospora hispaniola]
MMFMLLVVVGECLSRLATSTHSWSEQIYIVSSMKKKRRYIMFTSGIQNDIDPATNHARGQDIHTLAEVPQYHSPTTNGN